MTKNRRALFHDPPFSSVPDEIVVNCLARISRSHYRSLCSVSKSFHSLLSSPEIYAARSQIAATEPRLYLCFGFPTAPHHRWFTLITNPDQVIVSTGEIKGALRLGPLKLSSSHVRLNAATVAVGSEIYQIGGSNKDKPSRIVCVLDCRSHRWRRAPDMMVARKHAKSWFLDGKIYVMGGCRKRDKPMNWGEIFFLKTQTWKPLPSPSDDGLDPNHKVVVFGGKLYFITIHNKYVYDPKEGRWLQEVGFVGLEHHITRPWCVIENVIFTEFDGNYMWYNSRLGEWLVVEGLGELYMNRDLFRTIQLVNYGGKLVIILHERTLHVYKYGQGYGVRRPYRHQDIRIWCAVIRLEERFGSEICGEIERLRVVHHVPESYKLLTCQSVSL